MIKNFSIRAKLQLGLGLLVFLLGCLAVYLLSSVSNYELFLEEIEDAAEYNMMLEELELQNMRGVDLMKKYILDRNPEYIKLLESNIEETRLNLDKLRVLGDNVIILNSIENVSSQFVVRDNLLEELIEMVFNNEMSNANFFEKIIEMDKLSDGLIYDLERINEIATVDRLMKAEMLEKNFYLNRVTSIALLLIVTMLLIVVSYVLINSISNPLRKMILASEEIAKGNFGFAVEIDSNDEIGTLAKSFESMRFKLNDLYSSMEEKVNARTKKLDEAVRELSGTKESLIRALQVLEEKQKDIEQQKARFEAILLNIGEGLVFMNQDAEVVFGNPSVSTLLGYDLQNCVGRKWYDIVQPRHANGDLIPEDELSINKLKNQSKDVANSTLSDDHYYMKADGTLLPVSVVVSKVQNENKNEVSGLILVFRDVTKEKEVDKAKTEFVSLASHQLRTPLTSISWNTEMLMNEEVGKVDDEQKVYLEEIYYGSKRMINLVNSLLNTSRIDLGNFVIEPENIDVIEFTKEIAKELEPNFEERKIKLNEHYADIGILPIDKKLYHILIENLLTNAIKYTPMEGDVSLNVDKNENGIMIKVSDTGYGIPDDQKHKIFSKLFRADNVKSKDTDGTGLGLYLVKSIVDYIGGKIWFESQEDKGTTFYILLPSEGMKSKDGTKSLTKNKINK